jgi:integrase
MAKAKTLTPLAVQNAKPRHSNGQAILTELSDAGCRGLRLVVHPTGHKSWVVRYRHAGKSRKLTLGPAVALDKGTANPNQVLTLAVARVQAAEAQEKIDQGIDPGAEKQETEHGKTFKSAAEECFTLAKKKGLRSAARSLNDLERLVFPSTLGNRPIEGIKRSEITRLLDRIEAERGPAMADAILSGMSKVFGWWVLRSDDFASPLAPGMRRTSTKERARSRILDDDELRKVWRTASETEGAFAAFVQFLLLTACRRNEAACMPWGELSNGNGVVWCLPPARNKAAAKVKFELYRPLSRSAQAVLARLPEKTADTDLVFRDADGRQIFTKFSTLKKKFDAACGVRGWRLHDLRRTARSLMSRAGVLSEHAEKCLGHVVAGVEATYDRHRYMPEMLKAYEALATLIQNIVDPQPNVIPLHA